MANPLYPDMSKNNQMGGFWQEFNQFRQSFQGDPKAQVQQMLASGRITQQDVNAAAQQANQILSMFK